MPTSMGPIIQLSGLAKTTSIRQKPQLLLGKANCTQVLEREQMILVSCERAYATSY